MAKRKMTKNQRKKRQRIHSGAQKNLPDAVASWQQADGLHALMAGERPSQEKLAEMTRLYQGQIRKSPLFKQWVAQFGKKKALEMLKRVPGGVKVKMNSRGLNPIARQRSSNQGLNLTKPRW